MKANRGIVLHAVDQTRRHEMCTKNYFDKQGSENRGSPLRLSQIHEHPIILVDIALPPIFTIELATLQQVVIVNSLSIPERLKRHPIQPLWRRHRRIGIVRQPGIVG